ncbi:hypothetical protein BGZ52_012162, partial [Haplosporangium bisporale]
MTADDTSFITTSNTSYKTTSDDLTEAETPDLPFRITQPAHTVKDEKFSIVFKTPQGEKFE